MKPKGLGKGLSAIFETESQNSLSVYTHSNQIDISLIVANQKQPRTKFDQAAIEELAQSIERLGVIQPITVREIDGGRYEIISGERRFRASQMAGLTTIAAYVRTADDRELLEMALVENIQREELGALEIAIALNRLTQELGLTQQELSKSVGQRRSTVANFLRLLTLSPSVQQALRDQQITMGHAKVIAGFDDFGQQEALLKRIIGGNLSVRGAEDMAAKHQNVKKAIKNEAKSDFSRFCLPLEQVFGKNNVKIEAKTKGGRITITFASQIELSQIVERLKH